MNVAISAPQDHPHAHCIVTGDGLALEPEPTPVWRGPKQALYLFPVRAVARMFQGKFLAGLETLRAAGALEFHGRLESWRDPGVWEPTLGVLRGVRWNVFGYALGGWMPTDASSRCAAASRASA